MRLVVVSNWDVSLHERLAETGLAPLVDGAVASAEVGAAKPDRAIFAHALGSRAAPRPAGAGTSATRSAPTCRARARPASGPCSSPARASEAPDDVATIASLAELPSLVTT